MYGTSVDFSVLEGKRIKTISRGDNVINIETTDGYSYQMLHHQDCCESVYIEDIYGDLSDLVDGVVTRAEERSGDIETGDYGDVSLWTFYELMTTKGGVTIRWNGSSNGYYSVGVGFEQVGEPDPEKLDKDVVVVNNLVGLIRRALSNGSGLTIYEDDELEAIASALETVLGNVKTEK